MMVATDIGRNRKMRRKFTVEERWAWVGGVLCIAADAPIRGCFVVSGEPGTADDIADEAGVSPRAARSALEKFRQLEMLIADDGLHCERVRDWSDYNPEPKRDDTNAERQARFRAKRNAARNAESNGVRNAAADPRTNA
jgi:hypothetical protein